MAYHFNNRIKIVERVSSGPMPDSYTEKLIAEPWADIKTIRGNEYLGSGLTTSEIPVRFIIRYRDGITPKQRIKWKDLDFNIESVQNDNGKNETLTIFGKAYK
ncbi:TPA: phage head closure protein [Staphylococcus delphini]|nr:phage head closure protein [Staphylococcus delphini]HEC2177555.1 phage head closure protein [Staphylococcus delphini]HEC2186222.1 phage head closure protein [Staphylococcus delphini]HEC2198111.1 phage head closure protein [Staphylococcus delphini]HEC2200928.1 phage head closure protein [Staphylococcus delphini]